MAGEQENEFVDLVHLLDNDKAARYSALLLSEAIPHRTEWRQVISVPRSMEAAARAVLERAGLGGEARQDPQAGKVDGSGGGRGESGEASRASGEHGGGEPPGRNERADGSGGDEGLDEDGDVVVLFGRESAFDRAGDLFSSQDTLFGRQELPPSDEDMRLRKVWPAWALAAVPGLGLGHLYAGKHQLFFYLVFATVLGVLFYQFTGSYLSFLLVAFSWAVDLGFAAYHVKAANKRAERMRKRARQMEQDFLSSLDADRGRGLGGGGDE